MIADFLNFQPFGDHGVMSLLSIRMFHIIMIPVVWWMIKSVIDDIKKNRAEERKANTIVYRTRKDMFMDNPMTKEEIEFEESYKRCNGNDV
tara:strand:- start:269 stop:541 length:273 start_codon:yes stop_codon:yes gene_type:complete